MEPMKVEKINKNLISDQNSQTFLKTFLIKKILKTVKACGFSKEFTGILKSIKHRFSQEFLE